MNIDPNEPASPISGPRDPHALSEIDAKIRAANERLDEGMAKEAEAEAMAAANVAARQHGPDGSPPSIEGPVRRLEELKAQMDALKPPVLMSVNNFAGRIPQCGELVRLPHHAQSEGLEILFSIPVIDASDPNRQVKAFCMTRDHAGVIAVQLHRAISLDDILEDFARQKQAQDRLDAARPEARTADLGTPSPREEGDPGDEQATLDLTTPSGPNADPVAEHYADLGTPAPEHTHELGHD